MVFRSVRWLAAIGFLAGMFLTILPASAADVLKRRNIDDLSPNELAAYEHAIQILKDRSAQNQYDKSGYLWQAWIHNCPSTWVPKDGKEDHRVPGCSFWTRVPPPDQTNYVLARPGMCEHGKDLFLPWHRAEFYFFEKIIQGADPDGTITDSRGQRGPSTKNVTVPYWNWTRAPSGARYPKAFENQNSPLFHKNRASDPVAPGNSYPFSSLALISYMVQLQDWPTFGGFPMSKNGGYGSFEGASHNFMHALYMAGDMANPRTAALDPVFFSFHAFIDLLYEKWLQVHGKDGVTSQDFFLRGDQPDGIVKPPGFTSGAGRPSMGQVKTYFDTKVLGYEYEVAAKDEFLTREQVIKLLGLEDQQDAPVFGTSARNLFSRLLDGASFESNTEPGIVRTIDLTIPTAAAMGKDQTFLAQFDRNPDEPDLSYQMDVYLYPKPAPFDPASQPFRRRYLAAPGEAHWGTGDVHHHDVTTPMQIDITGPVLDLVKGGHSGEVWNLSVAISVLPQLTTFGEPSVKPQPPLR
jgi:hypothetical protein